MYINKLNKLDEMDKFPETNKSPNLTQKETKLSRSHNSIRICVLLIKWSNFIQF